MATGRRGPVRQKSPIKPRQPDEHPHFDVPTETQRLIGLAIINWSKLEADIEEVIWTFLHLEIDDGRKITTRLSAEIKIELLKSLVSAGLSTPLREGVLDVLDVVSILKDDRNFIVHGSWGTMKPHNTPICASLRPKAPPGEIVAEEFPDTRMRQIIEDILKAKASLRALLEMLETSRGKRQSQPLLGLTNLPQDQ